jgi:general L-amino acid transport system ATP-binding protein
MNNAPLVKLQNVSKYFGNSLVIDDITLDVAPGETVFLCGPSGSGKSTTLRLLNRLEEHQKGTITIDGVELNSSAANIQSVRAQVGMVFQHFNLFHHLSVIENCTLAPVTVKKLDPAAAYDRALHFLERVRMLDHINKYPGQLSGGQKQRVAIARSLCMSPKLMLFDEPTSALDPEMVREVLDTMSQLSEDGMTMICVTHEMEFARKIGDRIVFMDGGRIIETAPPGEFFTRARTERAKSFLQQLTH